MARAANQDQPKDQGTDVAVVAEQEQPMLRTKRVIIQRPFGNTDSHIHLGFNSFEGIFEFGQPYDLPADAVDYWRKQTRADIRPNDAGQPTVTYVNVLNIVDA